MLTVCKKVEQLINEGVLFPPIDGNHGEKHPKTSDFVDSGIPFILVSDLKDGMVDIENCNYITEEQAKTLSKGFSKTGDVLFTHKATIGKVAIVDTGKYDYIILTPQVTYYRIKNPKVLSHRYLYYYFKSQSFQNTFRLFASSGGTRDYLGIVAQQKLPIIYPDLDCQYKIADVLQNYDFLITNNNKRIKVLEQMAENLYKEWFVRFRFPGHETAEFENGIPKGWKVEKVANYARIKSGFPFKSEWWQSIGCPVVKIKDIGNGTLDIANLDCVSEEHTTKAKSFLLKEGDLVIAMTGATIGKIGLVPRIENLYTNQRVGKFFLGKNAFEKMPILYCLFSQPETVEMILCLSGASSAQPNISPDQLESIRFFYEENLVREFNKKTTPLFKEILELRYQNQNLASQRDLLLPRLMSGKLEV